MRKLILISLTILSANVYSQKGFYLKPVIEHKWHINNDLGYSVTTLQGYNINVRPLNFFTLPGLEMGIHVGYRTKNFLFETGWCTDESSTGMRYVATGYSNSIKQYYTDIFSEIDGVVYNKYPIRAGVKLFGKDSVATGKKLRWQGFLVGGYDILRRREMDEYGGYSHTFVINSNQDYVQQENVYGTQITRSHLWSIGFLLKGYNKKGRNIFNVEVHYSQGARYGQTAYRKITFTNFDGTEYHSFLQSKGSGLYITFSKDIYPINFFKKNKATSKFLLNKN